VQGLAETRDVRFEAVPSRGRRTIAPELVYQPVSRDDLVRPEQQAGQQRLLLGAAERDELAVVLDLERPENAKPHVTPAARRCRR
jgi:hypothetical protein